ncbi:MAG: hypothetical protein PHD15_04395 [Clostridia bacterium]|nr:hypothetical protein [Clostridia bacterium]MDD4386979.1 hypothetical protein [Clostridia bacterium]
MKNKKGISLIVLVITIIVIIILAGAVILSLANNNPIESANEATFKTNVDAYNSELTLAISNQHLQNQSFDPTTFDKGVWNGGTIGETIKKYIPSITVADGLKFEIQDSKLVYVGINETEQDWFTSMSMTSEEETGLGLNVIATDNVTFNGEAASYSNPIIPKGFMSIEDGAVWPTDWNNGLVIEDASGNQFVWVPVDGTNVSYAKWCTTGLSHSFTTNDSILSGAVDENTQVTTYGGFYIARYEAGNQTGTLVSKKDVTVWTDINYTNSKTQSEAMYNTAEVKSGLVTGTQWDTVMRWISNNSGPSVTNSTTWGNHSNSVEPGHGSKQIAGYSEIWKAKNIYDLAGNTWEWTNEIYSSFRVFRGGAVTAIVVATTQLLIVATMILLSLAVAYLSTLCFIYYSCFPLKILFRRYKIYLRVKNKYIKDKIKQIKLIDWMSFK